MDESGVHGMMLDAVGSQFDQYLRRQPYATRTIHKCLGFFQAICLGAAAGLFVKASLVTFWMAARGQFEIAQWWILFAMAGLPLAICRGLDAIITGAVCPNLFPGVELRCRRGAQLVTGRNAVVAGILIIVAGFVWSGFSLAAAYAVFSFDWLLLENVIRAFAYTIGVIVLIRVTMVLAKESASPYGSGS